MPKDGVAPPTKGKPSLSTNTPGSAESTGIPQLDHVLGGLFIGDNVIWYDDAGSLAAVFGLNLIRAAWDTGLPVIYVSFDRSPKNLFDRLGPLSDFSGLTVLDCFTYGKGAGAEVFLQFHRRLKSAARKRIVCVRHPHEPQDFSDALYAVADAAGGGARLIFESLTGMQEIWGGEDPVIRFYSRACPRLYEMNTIAYWLIEKGAHSPRLKSSLNQIAQVAVDLSVKRGRTLMNILKAERQGSAPLNKPMAYWTRGVEVKFESQDRTPVPYELGRIIKQLRRQRRISQTQLARLVGVTGSTISQVESNLILPSLPALFRMADILEVDIASLLGEAPRKTRKVVFPKAEAVAVKLAGDAKNVLDALFLTPGKMELAAEAYLVELPAEIRLGRHFSDHKGPELGHVFCGSVRLTVDGDVLTADAGDTIYLARETPRQWENQGPGPARLLWVTLL